MKHLHTIIIAAAVLCASCTTVINNRSVMHYHQLRTDEGGTITSTPTENENSVAAEKKTDTNTAVNTSSGEAQNTSTKSPAMGSEEAGKAASENADGGVK